MNKKLEEAIKEFEKLIKLRKSKRGEITHDTCIVSTAQLETVLNYIENSIPKKKVEEEINFIKTLDEKLYYQENVIQILQGLLEGK